MVKFKLTNQRLGLSERAVWGVVIAACVYILGLTWAWHLTLQQQQHFILGHPAPAEHLYFLDTDAYFWISYAHEMIENRTLRTRFTDIDNVPAGRAVHWSQPVLWLMLGGGKIVSQIVGIPLQSALPYGAIAVNPFLLLLTIICVVLVLGRNGFPWVTCWAVVALISLTAVFWDYHPFRPDHHSLHVFFALLHILFLAVAGMGWMPPHVGHTAMRGIRQKFLFAGICGGCGLWVGATITFFVVTALVAGILTYIFFLVPSSRPPPHCVNQHFLYEPSLWRVWGWAGGVTGLLLYLVEYFPAQMEIRLEVNHPLYALAFLACGEFLFRMTAWRLNRVSWTPTTLLITSASTACVIALPVVLLIAPSSWHHMQHEYMQRLHLFITEFRTISFLTNGGSVAYFLREYGALLLGFPLALWLSHPDRAQKHEWFVLWTVFIVALGFLLLTLWQKRWEGIFAAFLILLLVMGIPMLWEAVKSNRSHRNIAILFSVFLVAQPFYLIGRQWRQLSGLHHGEITIQSVAVPIIHMDRATSIATARADRDWRILAEPELVGSLFYFAGIRGVVSLYWENLEGLKAATDFFTDTGEFLIAKRVASERGLTHVMISATERMANDFYHIRHGTYNDQQISQTLAARMYHEPDLLPDWLIPDLELQAKLNRSYVLHNQILPVDDMRVFRLEL